MTRPRTLLSDGNVLVIAAHPDDEVLGAGATLARLAAEGRRTFVTFCATGATGRHADPAAPAAQGEVAALRAQAVAAGKVLGVEKQFFLEFPDNRLDTIARMDLVHALRGVLAEVRPTTVFVHHPGDYNWDHRIAFDAALMACRASAGEPHPVELYSYEVLSATERGPPTPLAAFTPTLYVDVQGFLEQKVRALECYAAELHEAPHPRSRAGVETLAARRGHEVSLRLAEAFVLVRGIAS